MTRFNFLWLSNILLCVCLSDRCPFDIYLSIYMWNLKNKQSKIDIDRENKGFPGGSDGKEFARNAGDQGSIPGWGRSPGGGHGNPLQYSCLENPHGWRSLVGYSL